MSARPEDRRTRSKRLRRRGGGVLKVEVQNLGALADQLVEAGYLAQWDSEDVDAITRALARLLAAGDMSAFGESASAMFLDD